MICPCALIKKKKKSFSLVLDSADLAKIVVQTARSANFSVLDPAGQIIFENFVKTKPVVWEKEIALGGSYTIEIESVALLFETEVGMQITVRRPRFLYGDPSMVDSLITPRRKHVLSDGEFQITKANAKTYPYAVEKGDTLIFDLQPISGNSPTIEVTNDFNELVLASIPQKGNLKASIPILQKGTYTLSMVSHAFFGKSNRLKVEKISPTRYAEPVTVPQEVDTTTVEEVKPMYDTIPELFMDTVIFLGAGRDIVHPNSQKLSFQFDNAPNIAYWGIFYGAGQEFLDDIQTFLPLLEGEALAAGATDVLSAYGLGYLNILPDAGSGQITFKASNTIKWSMSPPTRQNYALIAQIRGVHYLSFENKSLSAGQNVYVKIVLFRKEPK